MREGVSYRTQYGHVTGYLRLSDSDHWIFESPLLVASDGEHDRYDINGDNCLNVTFKKGRIVGLA